MCVCVNLKLIGRIRSNDSPGRLGVSSRASAVVEFVTWRLYIFYFVRNSLIAVNAFCLFFFSNLFLFMIGEIRELSRIWSFDRRFFYFRSKSLTIPVLGLLHLEKVQQPRRSAKKTQTYLMQKHKKAKKTRIDDSTSFFGCGQLAPPVTFFAVHFFLNKSMLLTI